MSSINDMLNRVNSNSTTLGTTTPETKVKNEQYYRNEITRIENSRIPDALKLTELNEAKQRLQNYLNSKKTVNNNKSLLKENLTGGNNKDVKTVLEKFEKLMELHLKMLNENYIIPKKAGEQMYIKIGESLFGGKMKQMK